MSKIFFYLSMVIFLFLSFGKGEAFSLDSKIIIHSSEGKGNLPPLYRMSFFTSNPEFDYAMKKILSENSRIGTIEFYLIHPTITPSENLLDLQKKLKEWDELALAIKKKGGNIVIEISGMPIWLSSNTSKEPLDQNNPEPKAYHAPPKDYKQWSNMVQAIVHHFNNELKIDAKYKIWGEPDWESWLGTEEEYFKLYEYSVIGAKKADAKAKIGGPSVGWWGAVKKQKYSRNRPEGGSPSDPMLYNYIKFCSLRSLPALGLKRLPIDFIVFHAFHLNPFSKESYESPVKKIRNWLDIFGYEKTTEILIGEWNIWGTDRVTNHIFSSREHDTNIAASYMIATLIAMDTAGINGHSFAYFKDFIEGPEFAGDFGLFTKNGIIKPSYQAMTLLSMLGSERVSMLVNDPFIAAVASKDYKMISLLFSHFIPTGQLKDAIKDNMMDDLKQDLMNKGYTADQLRSHGVTKEWIEKIAKGDTMKKDINLPDKTREDLLNSIQKHKQKYDLLLNELEKRLKSPASVEVTFNNLPQREYFTYERYTIDANHNNSYPKRNQIENAIKRAGDPSNSLRSATDYLRERGFSLEEINRIIEAFKQGKQETMIHSLSDRKKEDLAMAINIKNKYFISEIDKINEWPEIKLNKTEEKTIRGTANYRELITLAPYSVHLILLKFK